MANDTPHPVAAGVVRFLDDLRATLEAVEVTAERGAALGLAAGVARATDLVVAQTAAGRKLMFVGNGASAAIASHQAVDYWKTGRMRALAFNDAAQLTCLGNDFGYAHVFEKPVEMFTDPGDILVAISSSGRSENILLAARMARDRGAQVITLSGFASDNPLRVLGDVNFYVPSKSYGHVEVTHLALLHGMLDAIGAAYGAPPRTESA
jgi:D-sedoheptulose 7-phosphate isomerase